MQRSQERALRDGTKTAARETIKYWVPIPNQKPDFQVPIEVTSEKLSLCLSYDQAKSMFLMLGVYLRLSESEVFRSNKPDLSHSPEKCVPRLLQIRT